MRRGDLRQVRPSSFNRRKIGRLACVAHGARSLLFFPKTTEVTKEGLNLGRDPVTPPPSASFRSVRESISRRFRLPVVALPASSPAMSPYPYKSRPPYPGSPGLLRPAQYPARYSPCLISAPACRMPSLP